RLSDAAFLVGNGDDAGHGVRRSSVAEGVGAMRAWTGDYAAPRRGWGLADQKPGRHGCGPMSGLSPGKASRPAVIPAKAGRALQRTDVRSSMDVDLLKTMPTAFMSWLQG